MRRNGPFIATAAWSIPKTVAGRFPKAGSGLERYAAVFNGVEINSTFYRHHQKKTFERWASAVPAHFRFAVKIPREITHGARLRNIGPLFDVFVHGTPQIYYSGYNDVDIRRIADQLGAESWCVFDNTASGAAIENALTMRDYMVGRQNG